MATKSKTVFVCGECGYETPKWVGKCPGCGEWNTMVEDVRLPQKEAASVTATGNRAEWNRIGGFIIESGDSFNFTGNFFDRTFGPALDLGRGNGVNPATITGNVFIRGGAYDGKPFKNAEESSHMILENCT